MNNSRKNFLFMEEKDWDLPIYRIFPLDRVIEIFSTNKMALVKPKKWDDPFETINLSLFFPNTDGILEKTYPSFMDEVYAQCWTQLDESDALWRIYSPDKRGVRLSTTPRKLLSSLKENDDFSSNDYAGPNCYIGKVQYLDEKEIYNARKRINILKTDGSGISESFLYKRNAFQHEQEVRLIWLQESNKEENNDITFIKISFNDLFDDMVFDPRLEDYIFEYKKTVIKNNYSVSIPIKKSKLYNPPQDINQIYS